MNRAAGWAEGVARRLPEVYVLLALPITLLLCLVTAPFFAPDEANQSLRAITLAHGEWMPGVSANDEAGAPADTGAVAAMEAMNQVRMRWERRAGDFHNRRYGPVSDAEERSIAAMGWSGHADFVSFANTAGYPPWLYLPAMAGWRGGEAAGWTIVGSLRLARLICALAAVALGWLALRVAACSPWLLLPFLLLPSVLFLNAGSTQDALLLPVGALIAAIVSRPLGLRREFTLGELAAMTVLLAMAGTARPPNAAMVLVLMLPTVEAGSYDWRRWIRPAAAMALVLAICAWWRSVVLPLGIDTADEANPELQKIFLRTHPLQAAAAVARGTGEAAADLVHRGLYVIGWNDLLAPRWLALVLAICLAVVLVGAPASPLRTGRGRCLLGLSVVAPLLGISLAEYLIWTPPGWHTVYGIQPRYWLPVLPLAILLVKSGRGLGAQGAGLRRAGLVVCGGLLGVIAATLPLVAAHAFYGAGLGHVLRLNLGWL